MDALFTLENLVNLVMLCFLQAVLGFDNLLYIALQSKAVPPAQRASVQRWGIILAVILRVVLLFVMMELIAVLSAPLFIMQWEGVLEGGVNFASVIFFFGGVFLIYTALKEISHLLSIDDLEHDPSVKRSGRSAVGVISMIVLMNLIFSFDSVLSGLAITKVFPLLVTAILLSGAAMLMLSGGVTRFLEKNRMYEVLGLFVLLIVGIVLLGEAGPAAAHQAHDPALQIKMFGYALLPMSKSTFYVSVVVLFVVEILQSGYKRKLDAERKKQKRH